MKVLEKLDGISDVAVFGGGSACHRCERSARNSDKSARRLNRPASPVTVLEPIEPSMEDVFVAMIEREERKAA